MDCNYNATLDQLGFYKSNDCRCGGTLNHKYKRADGYQVYIQPRKQRFRIKKHAQTIVQLTPLEKFNELLTKVLTEA